MKPSAVGAAALLLVSLTACGQATTTNGSITAFVPTPTATASPTPSATSSPRPSPKATHHHDKAHHHREHLHQPIALPRCPNTPSPHFDTPQAAMTYLAAAWNRHDLAALCHVTNPNSRRLLDDMHNEALNLRLDHCAKHPWNEDSYYYSCVFDHDYPKSMHMRHGKVGHAYFDAGPADTPGWYMTNYEGCG
jgi:hypothetical protein